MAYQTAWSALADPTRRSLYERLHRRPHTVGELARLARVSQPAVSQHLRVLRDARLVTCEPRGTRRHYRASAEGLAGLRRWMETYWDGVLEAFAAGDPARAPAPEPERERRR